MASAAKRLEAVPGQPTPQIAFDGVTLVLGGKTIIENLSLGVRPGEFLCIVGASGCGKTTALRLAAGLYQPTSGKVNFDGQPMREPRREIAIVFQDYGKALLPWRTAAGNVSLALEAGGMPSAGRPARIEELLRTVGLPGHAGKYPSEMSGGMQQRLAVILEHDRDLAARLAHRLAVEIHSSTGRLVEAGRQTQRGGLAATGGADDAEEFAGPDPKTQILDDGLAAEDECDPVKRDLRCGSTGYGFEAFCGACHGSALAA